MTLSNHAFYGEDILLFCKCAKKNVKVVKLKFKVMVKLLVNVLV